MDRELKETLRSMSAIIYTGFLILIAMASFLIFHWDKSQIFWGIISMIAAMTTLVCVAKDVYDTLKYQKENKKEEVKHG